MPASCARYQQSTVAHAHIVLPYVGITSYKRSHQYPKVICYPNQRLRPVFKANSALSTSIPIRGRHRPCAAWAIAAAVVEARNPPQYSAYCMAARMGTPWCVAPSQQPRRLWLVSVQSEVTQVPVSSGWPTVRQSQSVFGRTCLCSVSRFTVSKGWHCSLLLVSARFCVGWSVKLRAYRMFVSWLSLPRSVISSVRDSRFLPGCAVSRFPFNCRNLPATLQPTLSYYCGRTPYLCPHWSSSTILNTGLIRVV